MARLPATSRARGRARWLLEAGAVLVLAAGVALALQAFVFKPFRVRSASMEPTLEVGQRVLVDRISSRLGRAPHVGDIVVFHPPLPAVQNGSVSSAKECGVKPPVGAPCPAPASQEADATFVKRVVAGPGDQLVIRHGQPIVDGRPADDGAPSVPCRQRGCDYPTQITVPSGDYFVMGDNRPASDDSRYWGPVPRQWILGKAVLTLWPASRFGPL